MAIFLCIKSHNLQEIIQISEAREGSLLVNLLISVEQSFNPETSHQEGIKCTGHVMIFIRLQRVGWVPCLKLFKRLKFMTAISNNMLVFG